MKKTLMYLLLAFTVFHIMSLLIGSWMMAFFDGQVDVGFPFTMYRLSCGRIPIRSTCETNAFYYNNVAANLAFWLFARTITTLHIQSFLYKTMKIFKPQPMFSRIMLS